MKIKTGKLLAAAALAVLLCAAAGEILSASAAYVPNEAYNYNVWGESVNVPASYEAAGTLREAGGLAFRNPGDLTAANGSLYVLDSGNKRIVKLDAAYNVVSVLEELPIESANGLFVSGDETYYIADKGKGQILVIDREGKTLRTIGKPSGQGLSAETEFKPLKVVVNKETLYVACEGILTGLLRLSEQDGEFLGFYGGNKVDVTAEVLLNAFWKKIMTQEQIESTINAVPMEYSSMAADGAGFIYVVTPMSKTSMFEIKKLDPKGNSILRRKGTGDVPAGVRLYLGNYGDIETNYDRGKLVDTRFIDVAVDGDGFISALDGERGRVFQYDQDSNLVGVFGGLGDQQGRIAAPSAVESFGGEMLVLDTASGVVHRFAHTRFGSLVREATIRFSQGLYAQSEELWREINKMSVNYELAYVGMAKAQFAAGQYKEAMTYNRLGYDKRGYDEAFTEYRNGFLRRNLLWVVLGLAAAAALLRLAAYAAKRWKLAGRVFRSPAYLPVKYYMGAPIKAADDIRSDDRGRPRHGLIILALYVASQVLSIGLTGFLFNDRRMTHINVWQDVFVTLGLYFGFILCNWAVSTLFDGEGRWRDIGLVLSYAMVPLLISNILTVALSNVLLLREGALLSMVSAALTVLAFFYLFTGIMTIHRYTAGKTLVNLLLTVAGMALVFFLLALIYGLFCQMAVFVSNILTELLYRF